MGYDWPSRYPFESINVVRDYATDWMLTNNNERPNMALGGNTPKQKLALTDSASDHQYKWGGQFKSLQLFCC